MEEERGIKKCWEEKRNGNWKDNYSKKRERGIIIKTDRGY